MKDMSFDEFNDSFQATKFNLSLTGSEIAVIMGALTMLRDIGQSKTNHGPITDLLLNISKQIDIAIDKVDVDDNIW